MMPFLARQLFDLQQSVIDKALRCAIAENNQKRKEELMAIVNKAIEVEKLLIIHIPKN